MGNERGRRSTLRKVLQWAAEYRGQAMLRRVHECVFGVLALESEPVDPRL